MRMWHFVFCIALVATPARADEPQPFRLTGHEQLADHISTGLVAANVAAETIANWRSPDRGRALGCQALRTGLVLGLNELVKRTVHRTRPDGSDDKSFYSMHTSLAMASSGWRVSVGVPIAVGAGAGRLLAFKHYGSDVAVGAAAGLLSRRICEVGS